MKDPGLPDACFRRDRVRRVRLLARPRDWRALGGARKKDAVVRGRTPLRLRLTACDLEGVDRLVMSLANLADEPLLAGLYLWWANPGGSALAFSGGRAWLPPGQATELLFPRQDFGTYGKVGPWAGVKSLELVVAAEKGRGPTRAVLELGELRGHGMVAPQGPRLTARGLAGLRAEPGQPVPIFGDRDHPGLALPPPPLFPRSTADQLLAGQILGERVGFPWDWGADPRQALEWRHMLHRHHDLRTLALAWDKTGRMRYLRALRRMLTSWIRDHPVPVESNGGAGPAWETLSSAWRLLEWQVVTELAWPRLGSRLQDLLKRSWWEHARHLADHRGHPTNWALIEAAALAVAGMAWRQFREAEGWSNLGLGRLAEQCRNQFNDDGSHCEQSPLYQALCLQALLWTRRACLASGKPWPRSAKAAMTKGLAFLAAMARPDSTWPALNDSGGAVGDYSALLEWAGHDLARAAIPRSGTRHFPQAGLVTLSGGRGDDSPWLLLRAGPPGLAHAHQDGLSLEAHWGGAARVVDPGIRSYAPDPMTDMYRRADSHSQPLLDGRGARPDPSATRLERSSGLLLAWGEGTTAAGGCLSRMALLVRGQYALVWDRAWGLTGTHILHVGWQLFPGAWHGVEQGRGVQAEDGFGLWLVHASHQAKTDMFRGRRRPPRGWVCLDGQDVAAPHWRVRLRGDGALSALWLLAPRSDYSVTELEAESERVCLGVACPDGGLDRLVLSVEKGATRLIRTALGADGKRRP